MAEHFDPLAAAFESRDWPTLLRLCEQSPERSDDSAAREFLHVYALVELGRLDVAMSLLASDRSIAPDRRAKTFRRVASALVESGREAEAVNLYRRAADAMPNDATSRILLGALLLDLGHQEAALACFSEATQCSDGHLEEAWLGMGAVYAYTGRLSQAEDCLLHALVIAPGDQAAIDALSRLRAGEFDAPGT